MQHHNNLDNIIMALVWIVQAVIAFTKSFMDIDFGAAYEIAFKITQFAVLILSGMASYRIYKKNK